MYTTREFARISAFSLGALVSLTALPASGQMLNADELGALLDKESMTKADHLKLADHYSAESKQLAKDADRHAGLAVHYRRRRNLPPKVATAFQGMPNHCEHLAQSLRNAAKASEELAAAHRAMADERSDGAPNARERSQPQVVPADLPVPTPITHHVALCLLKRLHQRTSPFRQGNSNSEATSTLRTAACHLRGVPKVFQKCSKTHLFERKSLET